MAKATKKTTKKSAKADIFKNILPVAQTLEDSFSNIKTRIPTGNIIWDIIMGGGIPVGRMIELSGFNGTGKSECLQIMAKAFLDYGGYAVIQDVEMAYDSEYIQKKGIDPKELMITNPTTLNESLDQMEKLLDREWDKPILIGIDSVAALGIEGQSLEEILKQAYPKEAKAWTTWFRNRSIPSRVKLANATIVFTNQTRKPLNAGIFLSDADYATFAGEAIKYYSSARLYIKKGATIKEKVNGVDKKTGFWMVITAIKSRVEKPFLKFRIPFKYGQNWDNELTVMSFLIDDGIAAKIKGKSTKTYTLPFAEGEFTEKGLYKALQDDTEFYDKCVKYIKENI